MGQVYECNATIQGVSVGYSDIYGQALDGQEIFFSPNACNGKYYIVSEFDPDSIFQELNENNNVTFVEVELKEQSGNCCSVDFSHRQLEINGSYIHFEDRSVPIPDKWIWEFGDGTASTEQFPTHEYEQPGNYTVTLSTENDLGCTSFKTIDIMVDSVKVGIQEDILQLFNYQSTLIPNPMRHTSTFQYNISKNGFVKVDVLDASGRILLNLQALEQQGSGSYELKISNLSKGIYLIRTEINGFDLFKKLVVI